MERPESIGALCECVSRRASEGLAIYPQGGRTALDYGGVPAASGVVVDVARISRVVDYPAADMTITVEAGMTLAAVQQILAAEGQRLPLDAPWPSRATLGGIYATNASGPRRFGAGRPRDLIIGVRFVSGEAKVIKGGGRVVKNVAGYDLPKLLTGSMGTLGIIAEMTLKVRPKPETTAVVLVGVESLDRLAALLAALNTSVTRPAAIEVWNQSAGSTIERRSQNGVAEWTLGVGFEDNATSVAWQVESIKSEMVGNEVRVLERADTTELWDRLTDFPAIAAGDLGFVANVRPSSVPAFVGSADPGRWALQAHAGSGIVRGFSVAGVSAEPWSSEIAALRSRAVADGGNLILVRCPTDLKEALRVWGEPRADAFLARKVKQALDPRGVMNPGRLSGIID